LGEIAVAGLTREQITKWHNDMAARPRLVRGKRGQESRHQLDVPTGADAIQRRRATVNRVLAILKAALNHAFKDGKTDADSAWRAVKPFREVETARVRHFSVDECRRLINAATVLSATWSARGFSAGADTGNYARYGSAISIPIQEPWWLRNRSPARRDTSF
jgi:hypothetical protein